MTKTLTQIIESQIRNYIILAKLSLSLSGLSPEAGETKRNSLRGLIEGEIKAYALQPKSKISEKQLSAAREMYGEISRADWTTRENIEKMQTNYR